MKMQEREHLDPIMRKDITYISGIKMEEAVEIIRHCFFKDEEMDVVEYSIHNSKEFHDIYLKLISYWNYERCINELHEDTKKESFYYYGVCAVCNSSQPFLVDYQSAIIENEKKKLNLRERLICPNCRCNSIQRFLIYKIFQNYNYGDHILLYEKNSQIYQKVKREIIDLEGFEYLGLDCNEKEVSGFNCEDICNLSYESESFSFIMANDVFEHTPEYEKAFEEAYRVLKKNGKLLFTVPFDGNSEKTMKRAELGENGIVTLEEEWYHNSRIPDQKPLLVSQIFGWDILNILRKCGFKDVCGKVYYGVKAGYMGYLPMYFEAQK